MFLFQHDVALYVPKIKRAIMFRKKNNGQLTKTRYLKVHSCCWLSDWGCEACCCCCGVVEDNVLLAVAGVVERGGSDRSTCWTPKCNRYRKNDLKGTAKHLIHQQSIKTRTRQVIGVQGRVLTSAYVTSLYYRMLEIWCMYINILSLTSVKLFHQRGRVMILVNKSLYL